MNPVLTIVTRHMPPKRQVVFRRLNESLDPIREQIQHLVLIDDKCIGINNASQLLIKSKDEIEGDYVLILDDDDTFTCPQLPVVLRRIKEKVNPHIIIVKNWMPKHGILPNKEIWQSKNILNFKSATIGMPGFILERDMYKRFIPNIAGVNILADWKMFSAIQRAHINKKFKVYWLDLLIMVQPMPMYSAAEVIKGTTDDYIMFGNGFGLNA